MLRRILSDYGMVLVLLALCVLFSILTLKRQMPEGPVAEEELLRQIESGFQKTDAILAVGAVNTESAKCAQSIGQRLLDGGFSNARVVVGEPRDLRLALDALTAKGQKLSAIATTGDVTKWRVIEQIPDRHPESAGFRLLVPQMQLRSLFLTVDNLLGVVDRIVVIAIIAIGMTMVIITAGIDLSVGSLIALSAVVSTLVMKNLGGLDAPAWVVPVGFLCGMFACVLVGIFSGFIVARFDVPPFIATLSIMMMARGLSLQITHSSSIYQVPNALIWLGQGRILGIPNTVILLVVLYAGAHVFMSRTRTGRYIYAVGGNEEAARLSGVPVTRVIVFVYAMSALAAGLGGCIQASQIKSGTPNMGKEYELYVIAAVVVGGTSLAGGTGRIMGTLVGAFVISVMMNGMNLLGMDSPTQGIVLGGVILGAVLLDKVGTSRIMAAILKNQQAIETQKG